MSSWMHIACEICGLVGLRFTAWLPLCEFPADLTILKSERCVKRPAFLRDKSLQDVAFTFDEHLRHLVLRDFALKYGFAHFERATTLGQVFANVSRSGVVYLSCTADLTLANRNVPARIHIDPFATPVILKFKLGFVLVV